MLQTPQEDAHQQRCQQAVEAYQRIEHSRRNKHIDGAQIILRRQQSKQPHRPYGQCCADGSDKEISTQFQVINPITQILIHEDDGSQWNQQHHKPSDGNAERAPNHQQHQCPPQCEQGDAQRRVIEKLSEITSQPRQQPTRCHHLLLQEQRRVEKEVHLLHLP